MSRTASDYKALLKKLLPKGKAWAVGNGSTFDKLLDAKAQEYARIDADIIRFINNVFPQTTVDFLEDWERLVGIPKECLQRGDDPQTRREDIVAALSVQGNLSRQHYIDLAKRLGYDITITEPRPFRVSINAVGDALYSEDWLFFWIVNTQLNTIRYFRVSENEVGDPLAYWSNERLECVMNLYKPAHTIVLFSYT